MLPLVDKSSQPSDKSIQPSTSTTISVDTNKTIPQKAGKATTITAKDMKIESKVNLQTELLSLSLKERALTSEREAWEEVERQHQQ